MTYFVAFAIAAAALAVAWLIYSRVHFLRRWFIPPALIAGVLLFVTGPEALNLWSDEVRTFIRSWPPILLGYLFAAIVLGFESAPKGSALMGAVVQQNLFVWFLSFGQLIGAYAIYLLFFQGWVSPLISHVIEIGWAGGPGSAAAMSAVMRRLGEPAIGDLGLFAATLGQVWGAFSGIWIVNRLNGRIDRGIDAKSVSRGNMERPENLVRTEGLADGSHKKPQFEMSSVPRILILGCIPLLAVLLGYLAQLGLKSVASSTPRILFLGDIPLFSLALICAFPIRWILNSLNVLSRENCETIQTVNGQVLDFIILAAMAVLVPSAFLGLLVPFSILVVWGIVFCFVVFFFFGPRMLPPHLWRELGLINYGFATGTTALGLMLLGLLKSNTREESRIVYGMAVPFNAPFVGGGIISLTLPEWTARGGATVIPILLAVCMIAFYFICMRINRSAEKANG